MIEIAPTQNRNYLSKFFTLQEKTKRRPILDCQKLNSFIQVEHFKMEGVPALRELIEKDDYICKVDLKDAYVVVPIHTESQDYLSFENEGVVYRYKSLAFGLSIAPRIFSKIMRYAIEPLRKEGIRIIYYLDDICILAKTTDEMNNLTQKVRNHLEKLGFIINYTRQTLAFSQSRPGSNWQATGRQLAFSHPDLAANHEHNQSSSNLNQRSSDMHDFLR
jgi:hypothetical protein